MLSESELHGLIDGQIEVHRRADILRRAAASTIDRDRIGSWQAQCELIRTTFRGIEREPLPTTLDLRAPIRLHSVPNPLRGDDAPIVVEEPRRRRSALPSLAALVAAAGFLATWLAGGFSLGNMDALAPDSDVAHVVPDRSATVAEKAPTLPTATIPDLTSLGFALTRAEMKPGDPATLSFHYRNADADELALNVSRTAAAPARRTGAGIAAGDPAVWSAGSRVYALTGSLPVQRLRALVRDVRDLAVDE